MDQSAKGNEVVFFTGVQVRIKDFIPNRRMQDTRFAAIEFFDLPGSIGGVCKDNIRFPAGPLVPATEITSDRRCQFYEWFWKKSGKPLVRFPSVAKRGMDVAHMLTSAVIYSFGPAGSVGDNKIVLVSQIEALGRFAEKRDEETVTAANKRMVEETCSYISPLEMAVKDPGFVEESIDRRLWEHPGKGEQHPFGAAELVQVVVDKRNFHYSYYIPRTF